MHRIPAGLMAAPFTPLRADGSLNLGAVPAYAAHLLESRVIGAFVCGTTGEGALLTGDERRRVAEAWCEARSGDFRIIVHAGQNAGEESRALARHAQEIGADGIAVMAPSFFRPETVTDLADWCASVASAAPDIPFYYYHMPAMAGSDFLMSEFLPLAVERIPNFAGIKFTHENLMDFSQTLGAAGETYTTMAGRDEILLAYLALGAKSAIGSTYNYAAPVYHRVMEAFAHGDLPAARRWQTAAQTLMSLIIRSGGFTANKAIMGIISGIDCGPVRRPLRNLTGAQLGQLRAALSATGLMPVLKAAAGTADFPPAVIAAKAKDGST